MDVRALREAEPTVSALRRLRQIDGAEFYSLADPDEPGERVGVAPSKVGVMTRKK